MIQEDLFGVTELKMPVQAADATRHSGYTCWEHCKHCEPTMLGNASKVYRLCSRVGSKCFPASEVCEWSNLFDHIVVEKPIAPGWSDF